MHNDVKDSDNYVNYKYSYENVYKCCIRCDLK